MKAPEKLSAFEAAQVFAIEFDHDGTFDMKAIAIGPNRRLRGSVKPGFAPKP